MVARIMVLLFALTIAVGAPAVGVLATEDGGSKEAMLARRNQLTIIDDDDDDSDGDTSHGGYTSGVNSNDATNSRFTPVSRDRDRSAGDLTRDRTQDGAGGAKRDWSRNYTNDWTRNDTR